VELEVTNLLIVAAAGFAAPLALGFVPRLRLPAVVLEIVLGIVIGPDVLGWVEIDEPVAVVALLGLAFLLFLAGMEVDLRRLAGHTLGAAGIGFALSLAIAVAAGLALDAGGLVRSPLLIAVAIATTGLGVVIPVLKDAGESETDFGQLVIVASTVAEFGAILLLTLLFSAEGSGAGSQALLLGGFVLLSAAAALSIVAAGHLRRLSDVLVRLQDTTAQIRVRGAVVLMIAFVALAEGLGLEAILGAFVAGALLAALDRDRMMTHAHFREKLEAAGYGVFIPVFFVATGVRFDLEGLLESPTALANIPIFLVAILAARGLPALLYRRAVGGRRVVAAALLQSTTSIAFLAAVAEIGMAVDLISPENAAALVGAGLLTIVVCPAAALMLLQEDRGEERALGARAVP
jgi:Kef-type K+ transport system membrane component KefB